MQKLRPIALAISYGRTDSVKNSGGALWNCYAEVAPKDAKTPITLTGSPGQLDYATLDTGLNVGPVCDGVMINELPYFVTTKGLYKITAAGAVKKLGALVVGPLARMASNGFDIMIVDGVKTWAYTLTPTEDTSPVAPVDVTSTSDLFPSATVTSIDSYFVFEQLATGRFFHTELASTDVDPLSVSTAEAYPDRALNVFSHRRMLFVGGTQSIEIFYNAGGSQSAFARMDGATIAHGLASPYSVAANEVAVGWLASNGMVYLTDGLVPSVISTQAIHDAIQGLDLQTATMCAYVHDGHPFFQLSVGTVTLAFDTSTRLWHGLRDETYGRHRATCVLRAFSKNLMGDAAGPFIRELTADAFDNAGDPLVLDIITPALHADQRVNKFGAVELELDTGEGGAEGTVPGDVDLIDFEAFDLTTLDGDILTIDGDVPTYPVINMQFSDDDGYTWSEPEECSMGYSGETGLRAQWRRLGAARSRRFRFTTESAVRRSLLSRAWVGLI